MWLRALARVGRRQPHIFSFYIKLTVKVKIAINAEIVSIDR